MILGDYESHLFAKLHHLVGEWVIFMGAWSFFRVTLSQVFAWRSRFSVVRVFIEHVKFARSSRQEIRQRRSFGAIPRRRDLCFIYYWYDLIEVDCERGEGNELAKHTIFTNSSWLFDGSLWIVGRSATAADDNAYE